MSADLGTVEAALVEAAGLLDGLADAFADDQVLITLRALGSADPAGLLSRPDFAPARDHLVDAVDGLVGHVSSLVDSGGPAEVVAVVEAIAAVVAAAEALAGPGLPPAGELFSALVGLVVVERLDAVPTLLPLLTMLGVVTWSGGEIDAPTVSWSALAALALHPATYFEEVFDAGHNRAAGNRIDAIEAALRHTLAPAVSSVDDPDRLETIVADVWPNGGNDLAFEIVEPLELTGTVALPVLRPGWTGDLTVAVDLADGTRGTWPLGEGPALVADAFIPTVDAALVLRRGPGTLLSIAGGPRLEADAVDITAGVVLDDGVLVPSVGVHLAGLTAYLTASDGLLASLFAAVRAGPVDVDLTWTGTDGLRVVGEGELRLAVPLAVRIGPVTVTELAVAAGLDGDALTLTVTTGLTAALGPFAVVVNGLGLAAALGATVDGGVDLGVGRLRLAAAPPTGLGLSIDAGAVAGGGYVYSHPETGQYDGVLELRVLAVGVSAVCIVDGPSVLAALYIEVPAIQLGFGFTLTGLGGLVGVDRTLDPPALSAAIRGGGLDTVLFPADPVANAPVIIEALRELFPTARGQTVFGPVVRLGWGTPSLIEATVGVVIALPDPIVVAVLGTVSCALPTADAALVSLHLDVAGVVDATAGTLAIDASLHDSWIAGFALSGDMALRADFGAAPNFLMALGGFHPRFIPPGGFPHLNPLTLAVSAAPVIDLHFSCYFALTSNTVQFGAEIGLSAQIEGFGIEGGTEFDALIFFRPLQLMTHLGFHVAITAVGLDLAGVWLDLQVVGPNPWHVIGDARFKVLGIETPVHVNEILGVRRAEELPDSADLRAQMLTALADPDNWSAVDAPSPGVILASTVDTGAVAASPDATVTLVQRVAPLDLTLDKAGELLVGDYSRFHLEADDVSAILTDWFPPGFYVELGASEVLTAPSFEQLGAGIEVGGGDPTAGPSRTASLDFEQVLRDPVLAEDRVRPGVFHLAADPRVGVATANSLQRTTPFAATTDGPPVGRSAATWAVTNSDTGAVRLAPTTWSAAHQSDAHQSDARRTNRTGATALIVPSWEVQP